MTDDATPPRPSRSHPPSEETTAAAARLGVTALSLTVSRITDLSPGLRAVSLADPLLAGLRHSPGQDLTLSLPAEPRPLKRRYSIRRLDQARAEVEIQIVLHGDGPGSRWASRLAVGERVEGIGPRGKITLDPEASWHLFLGDEAYLPASSAMAEALPRDRRAIMVMAKGPDVAELSPDCAAELDGPTWVERTGPAETAAALLDALEGRDLSAAGGHAYLGGEAHTVAALRAGLIARGLAESAVSAKAYWRADQANAEHGEPATA
jgi:NADPH-dependent ferric siderophore reductase